MNNIKDEYAIVYDKDKGKETLEPIDSAIDMAIQHRIIELEELRVMITELAKNKSNNCLI